MPSIVNFDPANPYTLYPPIGWQDAAASAQKCKELAEDFGEIFFHSSPITRCVQTIEVVASAFNKVYDTRYSDPRLGEWFVGRDFEGKQWSNLPPDKDREGTISIIILMLYFLKIN